MKLSDRILALLDATRPTLDNMFLALTVAERSTVGRELDSLAQHAARLAGMATAFEYGHSNESANDYGLRREKKVRKALGYTHP